MNEAKVRSEIEKLLSGSVKVWRQYPASKEQMARLTELGILELVPRRAKGNVIGYNDAAKIIAAAEQDGRGFVGGFNAAGEGDVVRSEASALYRALHEDEAPAAPAADAASDADEAPAPDDAVTDAVTIYNIQLESGGSEYRASDDSEWVLLRETWQRARLLNTQEVSRHTTRLDALRAKIEVQGGPTHLRCAVGQTIWDCLEKAGILYTRIGGWHDTPRDNEVLVATVRVHPHDPDIPVFWADAEKAAKA